MMRGASIDASLPIFFNVIGPLKLRNWVESGLVARG